jgi:methionyl-tRNA formyltransferase
MAYNEEDNSNGIAPSSLRLVFMGTPDFAVPSLLALIHAGYDVAGVVTQPDKPQGRHMIMTPSPVKITALSYGIPVFQPDKIRDLDFMENLKRLSPDLIITAAYGKILPVSMLELPRYGALNVHASLLPLYRGAAPVHWCVINGDRQTGITIMKMDKGMDTGAILVQKTVEIPFDINTGELMERLSTEGSKILSDTILGYVSGRITPVPQEESHASTVKPITKEDARIDWNTPVLSVYNRIRGCNPWPVAYTDYQGKRLKLYQARIPETYGTYLEQADLQAVPGSIIVPESKTSVLFVCSDGVLEITELQLEGSKRMPAGECAHNFKSFHR